MKGDIYTIGPHEYEERYRKECDGCREEIVMATDSEGRWHPFNSNEADEHAGESHYATCPEAERFRRRI